MFFHFTKNNYGDMESSDRHTNFNAFKIPQNTYSTYYADK